MGPRLLAVLFSTPMAAMATMAGAASIPVIIHLLNRRRFRVVDWGAMRFLQAALKRSVRRLRFEHWLLLAVRVLLVVLPILAMAAATPWAEELWERWIPSAAGPAQFAGRTHHIIVVDSSLSMTAQSDAGSAYDRAQSQAIKIVSSARGGDGFSVIQLAGPSRAVIPGPANDPQRVANDIREMPCTHGNVDLQQGLQLVHDIVGRSTAQFQRRVVYIITDLQRTQWAAPVTTAGTWVDIWQRLHSVAQFAIVDVGANRTDNLAISGLTINDSLIAAGTSATATFTVHNFGPADRKQVRLQISMAKNAEAGRPGVAGADTFPLRVLRQELLDIPADSSTTVSALIDFRTAGDYRLEARLEDDALATDNWRATNISVCDKVPVLVVNGRSAPNPWETASGWLAAALDPFPAGVRPPGFPARPQVIPEAKLDDPDLNFNKFGVVFLCDVARFAPRVRDRLNDYVRRGGTLVFGLGPQVDGELYRRLFYQDGLGLLPAQLVRRQKATEGQFYSLVFEDELFRRPPFLAFAGDDDRASLLTARFQEYWQVELSPKLPARRLGSFTPSSGGGDPLMVEWSIGQGRTILFTSTFNTQWSSWPIAPSYPPFVQELFRYAVRQPPRRDLTVGELIDDVPPENVAATEATIKSPNGQSGAVPVVTDPDGPRVRFSDTIRSGLYDVSFANRPPRVFAVNVPLGPESNLHRITGNELPMTGTGEPAIVVADVARVPVRPMVAGAGASTSPAGLGVIGSQLARWLLVLALIVILLEPILAWRYGSNRSADQTIDGPALLAGRSIAYRLLSVLSFALITMVAIGALIVLHAAITGEVLSFLPVAIRGIIERGIGVPPPVVGESTLWRFDRLPVFNDNPVTDRWLMAGIGILALGLCGYVYYRELTRGTRRTSIPMVGLRLGLVLLLLLVLMPQLRLVFERAGWPDYVVIIDDSKSMGVLDQYENAEMKSAITSLTDQATSTTRLQLAQRVLCGRDNQWIQELGIHRQSRLHIYHVSDRAERLATIDEPTEVTTAAKSIESLIPAGNGTRLGDAIRSVLEQFRGSALGGIMVLTDGVTTDGEDCTVAARYAARAGVPLTFVGIGDGREPKDVILSDLRVDDVVHAGDRLVFEARLTQRGGIKGTCPVLLYEKQGDNLTELGRQEVTLDNAGAPAKVRVTHTPKSPGEHVYVLKVPAQHEETDLANNRLERSVVVAEFQRTRVLFVEGRPRNDYRFAKTLLEREIDSARGNKSIELRVLLADADLDYARQDRTALESFPASKEELFRQFDVVILGDIEPNHPLLGEKRLQWIADFVREKGGGLLILCGQQAMPRAFRGTPLADILPVDAGAVDALGTVRQAGYKPKLTSVGRTHPVLRFVPDEQDNIQVWDKLKPFLWAATGLKLKPAAEVLATLPPTSGTGDGEPLIVQQFVGAGRVLLIGFEESWRWRFRAEEIRFNQFWIQLVRFLARTRPSRPEIRLDWQSAYHRGDPIRVSVHFPEDKPAPESSAATRVEMKFQGADSRSETSNLQLAAVPGAPRTFETVVTRTPEGSYSFTLRNANGDQVAAIEGRVLPPPGEMDRLKMNRADMERAAQISRGRFYTLANIDRVIDELPPIPHVTLNQPRPPWPIWNTPLIVFLGLALVGSEWVLRKRQQLL